MVWDAGTIAAIFQGLAALLTVLGLSAASRSRRAAIGRAEYRQLQRENQAGLSHIYDLELRLLNAGLRVPRRPAILERRFREEGITDGDSGSAPTPATP